MSFALLAVDPFRGLGWVMSEETPVFNTEDKMQTSQVTVLLNRKSKHGTAQHAKRILLHRNSLLGVFSRGLVSG